MYGLYLLNGGTPEGFLTLTDDDIQIMFTVKESERMRTIKTVSDAVNSMFNAKEL